MPTTNKTNLKQILRDDCLQAMGDKWKYYSTEAVKAWLNRHKLPCPQTTLNRYLYEFYRHGLIYDAGRGWYSSLATAFTLNREPVSSLVQKLNKTFPLLDFSVWSTEQIASYGHHLLANFVSFIHTERDNMESVAEELRKTGWTVYLHPTQQEATKSFRLGDKTAVIRPAVSRAPVDGHYATIEKILVDLCTEAAALRLLDDGEYRHLVANLAGRNRIAVGTLAQYAERRNLKLSEVLPGIIN